MTTQSYPLAWPTGWPRTKSPQNARFRVTPEKARQELIWEVERMGGRYIVLSTNLPLRRDGRPYAGAKPDGGDHGVSVYFMRKGKQMVFACDRWTLVEDNMRAIQKTIEAMRGIERWGASDMMERAFSAFEALPAPGAKRPWMAVLGFKPGSIVTRADVELAFRDLSKRHHPDVGGTHEAMAELTVAKQEALEALR